MGFIDLFCLGVLLVEQTSAGSSTIRAPANIKAANLVGQMHDLLEAVHTEFRIRDRADRAA